MLNRGDPSTAFKQEQALQALHADVPELRELLRWARLHIDDAMIKDSFPFSERALAVLGEQFANSGDGQLAPKIVRKKQATKKGQPHADNTARTQEPDGRQPGRDQPIPDTGTADPNLRRTAPGQRLT